MGVLDIRGTSFVRPSMKSLDDERIGEISRAIYDTVNENLEKRLTESETRLAIRLTKAFEDEWSKRVKELIGGYERKLSDLQEEHQRDLNAIKSLLQNINIKAIVPNGAINVTNSVMVPDNAINVEVKQLPSVVNVPSDAINVNVKSIVEQKPTKVMFPKDAIVVQSNVKNVLEMPERETTTEKAIQYDEGSGRPAKVVETVREKSILRTQEQNDAG